MLTNFIGVIAFIKVFVTLEQYNGFELNGRILRVHFDKFAASHAKFREDEANTFGQRQIHDPASLELLRQTYLPPQQLPTALPYGLSTLIPPQVQQQQQQLQYDYYTTTSTNSTYTSGHQLQQQQQPQMPFTDIYHGGYNPNAMYTPVNNFGYQHSPSFTHNTTSNTNYNPSMYGYHTQYWMPPQQQPLYQPNNDTNDLSSSINALHIQNNTTTTSPDSAGLNKKDWY